jgi:hypothetical protein
MSQYTASIQALYVAYFNRPADPSGLAYWEPIVAAANGSTAAVSADFAKQPEYKVAYAGMSDDAVINQVYLNLFGRTVDSQGLNFWSPKLTAHLVTIDQIVTEVAKGAQGLDLETYENRTAASVAYTNALNADVNLRLAYSNAAAITSAKNFLNGITTDASLIVAIEPAALAANLAQMVVDAAPAGAAAALTTGIDHLVGTAGNDTFTAVQDGSSPTFSALDSIDGGAGVNTFTIAQNDAIDGAPAGATVKNITVMNLISGDYVDLNATAFGAATINVTSGDYISITAADASNVNALSATNYTGVFGGLDVAIKHSISGNVYVEGAAGKVDVTSKTGTVRVVEAGGAVTVVAKGGSIYADGATTNVTKMDAATRADVLAHIAAATAATTAQGNAVIFAGNAADVFDNVTALKSGVAAAASFTAVASLTLAAYNNGDISREQKIAIDAAFKVGSATDVETAQSAAAAVVTPIVSSALADKSTTALDVLTADAALLAANDVVNTDAGSGNSYVEDIGKAMTAVSVTGNFGSTVYVQDSSTLHTTLTKVTLDHAGDASLVGNAITDITIANSNKSVSVNNTTANHTDTLTLSAVTSAALVGGSSGFTDNSATTINVTSNGSATNQFDSFSAAQATALNITGTAGFRAVVGATLAANAVITATASSGSNNLTISAGQSFLGGSGNDTVTTTGSAVQSVVVDGGAGTADRLNVSNAGVYTATTTTNGAAEFRNFEILGVSGNQIVDVRDFANSSFTSISSSGINTINGLSAAQANAVTVTGSGALTLGVVGATTVGQLDAVHLTTTSTSAVSLGQIGLAGVETLNLTANARGAGTTITSLESATALTAVNIDGGRAVSLTTGALALNVNTVIDAHANTGLTMKIDAGLSTINGLKIIGSATGANTITLNHQSGVIIAGDGDNTLTSFEGNDSITSGNGDSTVNAGEGKNTVTVGNGFNAIVSGAGNDSITVGSGNNTIDSGTGADSIKLAAHSIGHVDYIAVAAAAAAGVNMDTITGFISGQDVLQVSDFVGALAIAAGTTTLAPMLATVSSATSVASAAAVYTALAAALNGTVGHEFAASTAADGGLVAREVTFTTGAAAGTYLVINDDNAGFDGAHDIVIKLVGNTTIAASDIVTIASSIV